MKRYLIADFIKSNLRRFHKMEMISLICLLVAFGPLSCEENSLVGYRMYWKHPKAGLFHPVSTHEVRVIMYTLVCVLCILHMLIMREMRKNKRFVGGRFQKGVTNSLREMVNKCREIKLEVTRSLKRDANLVLLKDVRGILFHLKDSKLEMLVWFVLHDKLRVDLRAHRILSFKFKPVYTVEEILAGKTEEFQPLQEFILKGSGKSEKSLTKPASSVSKKTSKPSVKQMRCKAKNVSKPKERVEDMGKMISSMFAPCLTKKHIDNDYKSFLYPKIKRLTETSAKMLCLPTGGYEKALERNFEEESVLYSGQMEEDAKRTVKAHFMMAGGFANDLKRLADQETRIDNVAVAQETQESGNINYVYELPVPTCSLGEVQAEGVFSNVVENEVQSRRTWEYKDYAKFAVGCGAVGFALFSVYKLFRD